jgi:hypothetical protein
MRANRRNRRGRYFIDIIRLSHRQGFEARGKNPFPKKLFPDVTYFYSEAALPEGLEAGCPPPKACAATDPGYWLTSV